MQIVSGLGMMVRKSRAHHRGGPWPMGWGGVARTCSPTAKIRRGRRRKAVKQTPDWWRPSPLPARRREVGGKGASSAGGDHTGSSCGSRRRGRRARRRRQRCVRGAGTERADQVRPPTIWICCHRESNKNSEENRPKPREAVRRRLVGSGME
jgi:hypothetical protein